MFVQSHHLRRLFFNGFPRHFSKRIVVNEEEAADEEAFYNSQLVHHLNTLSQSSPYYRRYLGNSPESILQLSVQSDDDKREDITQDWNNIHGIVTSIGVPELADQLSGAVYMHALLEEDKCSKCIRLGETLNRLSLEEMKFNLLNIRLWNANDTKNSYALQTILRKFDSECFRRSLEEDNEEWQDEFWAFHLCALYDHYRSHQGPDFPNFVLDKYVNQYKTDFRKNNSVQWRKEDLVLFNLLTAFVRHRQMQNPLDGSMIQDMENRLLYEIFNECGPIEIWVCVMGMKALNPNEYYPDRLESKIVNTHGFRIQQLRKKKS